MFKEVLFNEEARTKIVKGVNIVSDAVCATLGPRGTHVIYEDGAFTTITKDGVSVAQQVYLEDKFENLGASMAKEAAEKTNSIAGDGTTGTICILSKIINEGNRYIVSGMNPVLIKRGMDKALEVALTKLDESKKELKTEEDKINIATISANNDRELGNLIVDVVNTVGTDGVVTVTTNNSFKTEVEYIDGTRLDTGLLDPIYINDSKRLTASMDNPSIIITSDVISTQGQLIPLLQKMIQEGKKEMVLFAKDFEGQALAFLRQNLYQGKFICIPVKLPSFGIYQKDIMNDLSALIGAQVVGTEEGVKIENAETSIAGTCDNIIISRDATIISGGTEDVSSKIEEVKSMLDSEKDTFKIEKLKERLGKLTGKIANIKVGGASDTEQSEIKYRIEDALNATKNAIKDGIVEGAGVALLRISEEISTDDDSKESQAGLEIVKSALKAPFKKIISNGGDNADAIMGKVLEGELGYNSLTKSYENLFETGIIDPKKVIENEITNAVATAGILLTSSVAIVNKDKDNK